jgi:hypothetical protein
VTPGAGTLTITGELTRADLTALTAPGRLAVYDWERSVLGADGRPHPADDGVTGGPGAGTAAGLSEAEARERAAKVPGAQVVQAQNGWFALAGDPSLSNADLARAHVAGGPSVALGLTAPGRRAFRTLTRELAHRGADQALSGDPLQSSQHLAIVLDDRLLSTPYVNWREAPDGLDPAAGLQISGLADPDLTAALLTAGPLDG